MDPYEAITSLDPRWGRVIHDVLAQQLFKIEIIMLLWI